MIAKEDGGWKGVGKTSEGDKEVQISSFKIK